MNNENTCSQLLLHHIPKKTSGSKIQQLHINIITIPAIHKILAVTKGFTKKHFPTFTALKEAEIFEGTTGQKAVGLSPCIPEL
jgi:hypothetical protein